jgi:hypothetical protein
MNDLGQLDWGTYWLQLTQGLGGDANLDGVVTISDFGHWLGLLFQLPGAEFLRLVMQDPGMKVYWEMDGSVTGGWAIFWACVGWLILYSILAATWEDWQAKWKGWRHRGK